MVSERADGRLQMVASDVVEVDVDPVRSELGESGVRALLVVVEGVVEPQLAQPLELLRRSGAPDDAAAGDARHLPCGAADGACCAGDEDGVALLRLAEDEQPVPGGEARHAEDAESGRDRSSGSDRACASVAPSESAHSRQPSWCSTHSPSL